MNLSPICALIAAIALAALPARAEDFPSDPAALYARAKAEGTLTWYDNGPVEPFTAMAHDFEAKYPGIKVILTRIPNLVQYQRFIKETDAGQYVADIVNIGDQPSVADLVNRGYSAEWPVPTASRLPDAAKIKDFAYAPDFMDVDIAYNPKKVTPEEVKILAADWKGILDPRFKGRIAVTDQKCGVCYGGVSMFLAPQYSARYGWDFLKAVAAQKPAVYNDIIIPVDRVAAGEQDVFFMGGEGVNTTKWMDGAPIQWVHPKPTPLLAVSWYQISKFAPHPASARLFLTWITSDDGAHSFQNRYGGFTQLAGIPDQRKVAQQPWYMPITERYTPDFTRWANNFDHDMDMWSKLLKANR